MVICLACPLINEAITAIVCGYKIKCPFNQFFSICLTVDCEGSAVQSSTGKYSADNWQLEMSSLCSHLQPPKVGGPLNKSNARSNLSILENTFYDGNHLWWFNKEKVLNLLFNINRLFRCRVGYIVACIRWHAITVHDDRPTVMAALCYCSRPLSSSIAVL